MFILTDEPIHKVNYITVLIAFSGLAPNFSVLLKEKDGQLLLPACPVQEESSIESSAKLLFELTGVLAKTHFSSTGYEDLINCGIHDNPKNKINGERTVYTLYGVKLAGKTIGNWVPLNDTRIQPDMLSLILEVGRQL